MSGSQQNRDVLFCPGTGSSLCLLLPLSPRRRLVTPPPGVVRLWCVDLLPSARQNRNDRLLAESTCPVLHHRSKAPARRSRPDEILFSWPSQLRRRFCGDPAQSSNLLAERTKQATLRQRPAHNDDHQTELLSPAWRLIRGQITRPPGARAHVSVRTVLHLQQEVVARLITEHHTRQNLTLTRRSEWLNDVVEIEPQA